MARKKVGAGLMWWGPLADPLPSRCEPGKTTAVARLKPNYSPPPTGRGCLLGSVRHRPGCRGRILWDRGGQEGVRSGVRSGVAAARRRRGLGTGIPLRAPRKGWDGFERGEART